MSAAGEHQLSFRSNHLPELGVYLVNALVPTANEIKLGRLERDPLQREMRLSFQVTPLGHALAAALDRCLDGMLVSGATLSAMETPTQTCIAHVISISTE